MEIPHCLLVGPHARFARSNLCTFLEEQERSVVENSNWKFRVVSFLCGLSSN